jgi:hypothetical protein
MDCQGRAKAKENHESYGSHRTYGPLSDAHATPGRRLSDRGENRAED